MSASNPEPAPLPSPFLPPNHLNLDALEERLHRLEDALHAVDGSNFGLTAKVRIEGITDRQGRYVWRLSTKDTRHTETCFDFQGTDVGELFQQAFDLLLTVFRARLTNTGKSAALLGAAMQWPTDKLLQETNAPFLSALFSPTTTAR